MSAKTRRAQIEQRVLDEGEIEYASLAQEYGVSEMTIRRDVDALEASGLVRRITGGAIKAYQKAEEPSFESRASRSATEKMHIAEAAVELLEPGETVILDSGSTVLAVARAIRGRRLGLTIVTPSLLAAIELADEPDTTIIVTGGQLRPGELSLIGFETEAVYRMYNCDTYIMGVAGVDPVRGLTDYHRVEGSAKRAAAGAADRIIVVADESKLGRVQLLTVAPLSAAGHIVTDSPADHPTLVAARNLGVEVLCVDRDGKPGDRVLDEAL
ncbi:DeoR/GlpR family DNA-binding transcription regulator [Mycolicibacterium aromaticivorans]|uniref:DeoR/GlpR family DNA-binding transcription regulator n=1 Tax=Mycolicibacterium aromaticivorans TaxID=318425 RepID=UPI001ED9AC10|nr:DeoR/GlpR family DNA-binding transcription regulator [Mycolicibacterium aromaticivorans]